MPSTVAQMVRDAIVFLDALGLKVIDLLGGCVAQEVVLIFPTWSAGRADTECSR